MNHVHEFQDAIRQAGLNPPTEIEPGKLHRFATNGKRLDAAGWCRLFPDMDGGVFGDHRSGLYQVWQAKQDKPFTPAEREAFRQKCEAERLAREAEDARRRLEAREQASLIYAEAYPATEHPYLTAKGIKTNGARIHDGSLVLPVRDAAGTLHSLQFIDAKGSKRFLPGGKISGCYFGIGTVKGAGFLCIAEGFATGATIHEATGYPVAVAFHAGNLQPVAQALREKFPSLHLIVAADDDAATEGNPGMTKATEAALAVDGLLAVPAFGADRPDGATDFNDLAKLRGLEAVRQCIAKRATVAKIATFAVASATNPRPLVHKVPPEPYPIDALPGTIRAAVEEVAGFVKAPLPMVASSALAALSVATQAHVDAKRAERLQGPVGLFLLTIADSGERKSTCDGFFSSAIRQYQEEQAEAAKPAIKEYQAAFDSWEAEREGILAAIKQAAKTGKPTDKLRADLAEIQRHKPEAPRVPRLLLGDETPEHLAWGLAKNWPSVGVVSAEAGIVFGAHGMSGDSVMRNLGLLNVLWDGGSHSVGRRTSESFTVKGARLTVALQIQEATLRSFFERSGGLARGTGFLARFLVAWPESTQGSRPFTEAPANWPHLATFHKRIAAILANPVPIDEDGALSPALVMLSPEAKAAWVEFHDAIERELASGGELYDVRDVASKSADNAARLAVLFQIFEHGIGGAVGLECFESASRIAAWHLNESRRFFGELALPAELVDATRLDTWLVEYCKREKTLSVGKHHVRQHGPIRDGARLDAALRELSELDRVQLVRDGKRLFIEVNPALVGVTP